MNKGNLFVLEDAVSAETVLRRIRRTFTLRFHSSETKRRYYFDTFDWRLYHKGYLLKRSNGTYGLVETRSGHVRAESLTPAGPSPRFWWEFPEGNLRDTLRKIIDLRSLLTAADLFIEEKRYNLVNEDEKIVSRIQLLILGEKRIFLRVAPVRGYTAEYETFTSFLTEHGMRMSSHNLLDEISSILDRVPGNYSSKPNVHFAPRMPAPQAVKLLTHSLISIMRQNEQGLLYDIDVEYLHDTRIAVRQLRAVGRQFSDLFSPEIYEQLKNDLKWIAGLTGEVRDLDVYILREEQYRNMLPPRLHKGLNLFFHNLRELRKTKFHEMRRAFQSEQYQSILQRWEQYAANALYDNPAIQTTSFGNAPVYDLVTEKIGDQFKKIEKKMKKAKNLRSDEAFHTVRIECKRLRYLLELFTSLYPESKIKPLVKRLKSFHEKLGNLNDMAVQEQMLRYYLSEMHPSEKDSVDIAAAVGGLITKLTENKELLRTDFEKAMESYMKSKDSKYFRKVSRKNTVYEEAG
jgi:CHAD domain-containing protein